MENKILRGYLLPGWYDLAIGLLPCVRVTTTIVKRGGRIKIDGGGGGEERRTLLPIYKIQEQRLYLPVPTDISQFLSSCYPRVIFAPCVDKMSLSLFHRKSRISAWFRGNQKLKCILSLSKSSLTKIKVI